MKNCRDQDSGINGKGMKIFLLASFSCRLFHRLPLSIVSRLLPTCFGPLHGSAPFAQRLQAARLGLGVKTQPARVRQVCACWASLRSLGRGESVSLIVCRIGWKIRHCMAICLSLSDCVGLRARKGQRENTRFSREIREIFAGLLREIFCNHTDRVDMNGRCDILNQLCGALVGT